jgi:hypothetical protein
MNWLLLPAGVLETAFVLIVFDRLSNKKLIHQATQQLWANLFSIRLFADNPRVVIQSLGRVIAANLRLLLYTLPPLAVTGLVFVLSYGYLDAFFGSVPLRAGTAVVLTVRLNHLESGWPDIRLDTPDWIVADAPPVHLFDDRQVCFRITARKAARGLVTIHAGNDSASKVVDFRPQGGWFNALPGRISKGNIAGIELFQAGDDGHDWSWQLTGIVLVLSALWKWIRSAIARRAASA